MKILIVSDTHRRDGNLREIIEKQSPFDMLIHLGDTEGSEAYFKEWVNNDNCVTFELETIKEEARARKADIVMFGHTHKPHLEYCEDGLVVLNPGSLSYPRQDGRKPSYMLMELDRNGEAHYTVCYVDQDRDIPSGLY